MSTNPFVIDVVISGQGKKLFEQLSGLTSEQAQELLEGGYFTALREAKKAGRLPSPNSFRLFLSGDCKLVRTNLVLDCSKPFDPFAFIGAGWEEVEQDERAYALTSVDFSKCQFLTCLKKREEYIKGDEKLRRLKEDHPQLIRHGGNQWLALLEDYRENIDNSVLEHLRLTQDIAYLDFPGLILQSPRGLLGVLYLYWDAGRWCWDYYLLGYEWVGWQQSSVSPAS